MEFTHHFLREVLNQELRSNGITNISHSSNSQWITVIDFSPWQSIF